MRPTIIRVQRNLSELEQSVMIVTQTQWRTQTIFMGGVSLSGIWWSFVFGVPCWWRQNLTSYSCFQTNVFVNFLTQYACSSTRTSLILCAIALNINYQRFRLGYRSKYAQIYDTAVRNCKNIRLRITGRKNRTHHCVRAIYNCKMKLCT